MKKLPPFILKLLKLVLFDLISWIIRDIRNILWGKPSPEAPTIETENKSTKVIPQKLNVSPRYKRHKGKIPDYAFRHIYKPTK